LTLKGSLFSLVFRGCCEFFFDLLLNGLSRSHLVLSLGDGNVTSEDESRNAEKYENTPENRKQKLLANKE